MLVENPFGILEDNKKYKNPHSVEIRTGKEWVKLFEDSNYEIFYNDDLRSLVKMED